jgi:hypothetical protein
MREFLKQKPWIGWVVAGMFFVVAAVMVLRNAGSKAPDSVERRSEQVTIRCTETGNEWQMTRGRFERLLLTQDGMLDASKGIPSEFAEGRLTGVLVDKSEWEETVSRINAMKKAYQD